MRIHALGGLFFLAIGAAVVHGGGTAKEPAFEDAGSGRLKVFLGKWQATVETRDGWQGTLRADVALKRDHPEESTFHAFMVLDYDLKLVKKKDGTKVDAKAVPVVTGTERVALFPLQKGKQHYVQLLRDYQVLQRLFAEEVLEFRPKDAAALKIAAELKPSKANTAAYSVSGNTWTLQVAPILLQFLPTQAPSGPRIDWEDSIVWKKVSAK
jgi:hypothetical protein